MVRVRVLVAATAKDLAAELILDAVTRSAGMVSLLPRVVAAPDIHRHLAAVAPSLPCALVLVGPLNRTRPVATTWTRRRRRLVVAEADATGDVVRITAQNVGIAALLGSLREMADRDGWWTTLQGAPGDRQDAPNAADAAWRSGRSWRPLASIRGLRRLLSARHPGPRH